MKTANKTVDSGSSFQVGAAMIEISPAAGVQLAGDVAWRRPAHSILDPLYARAIVFAQQDRKLCFLGLDVTFIDRAHTAIIRKAAERMGFDPAAILIHATQTHSAPPIGHFLLDDAFPLAPEFQWLRLGDPDYSAMATERAIEALRQAIESLRPAQLGTACAIRDGLAFNRRGIMRDGTVGMPWTYSSIDRPLGATEYRFLEGPTDPEIGVLCVRDESLHMVAMLLHFTCHPVNDFFYRGKGSRPRVSADWPGAWGTALQAVHGSSCVPLVLNGCCGNINPWPAFEPDFVPDHRRMGKDLADISDRAIASIDFRSEALFDYAFKSVPIPLRALDADRLQAARDMLTQQPTPLGVNNQPDRVDWDWFQSAMMISLELERQREPDMPYEIQVLRVGDTAFVGLPGEPFVEGQLQIKLNSPAYSTFVAHACNHFAGYIPTREAFARGGHEVNHSSWSRLAPEALDIIMEESIGLLKELYRA